MKKIQFGKRFFLMLYFFILGCWFLFLFLKMLLGPRLLARELEPQYLAYVKEGQYVKLHVKDYQKTESTFFYGYDNCSVYEASFDGAQEITCRVALKKSTSEHLTSNRSGNGITVITQAIKTDGFQGILFVEPYAELMYLYFSAVFFLFAILLIKLFDGGFGIAYVAPFEDSREYKRYFFGYVGDYDEILQIERRLREDLWKRQKKAGQHILIDLLILIAEIVCVVGAWRIGILSLRGRGFSYVIIGSGINLLMSDFLDSDIPLAKIIAEKCALVTLPIQIEEKNKLISALEHAKREREEKRKRAERE